MPQVSALSLPSTGETLAPNAGPSQSGTTINDVPAFLSNAANFGIQGGEFYNVAGHVYRTDSGISDESRSRSAVQEGSTGPSPLQWMWSLYSTFSGGRVPPDCQIYAQSLMPIGMGFPLWFPEPGRRLPVEYRMKGVSIGDVGLITPDGAFDYLFNICLPWDDPVNVNRVPENFVPLESWDPSDVHEVEFAYPPGGHVASGSIERGVSVNIDHEYSFQCLTSEGAILTLPDGASRENLRNLTSFQEYASRNAINWYVYANGTRGCQAKNGSIYLVTGCDKGKSWGVAAFSNVTGRDRFSLQFTAPQAMIGQPDRLYSWQGSSLAKTRAGPMPVDYLEGTHDRAQNQCLFLRGFRVALGRGVWANLLGPTGISRIEDIKAREIFPCSVPGAGGPGQDSLLSRHFQHSGHKGNQGTHQSGQYSASETTRSSVQEDVMLVTNVPETCDAYHPSFVVNQYLLEQMPSATVAITHDDDWGSVIDKGESVLPDALELIDRLLKQYKVLFESGAVSLVKNAILLPDSQVLLQTDVAMPDENELSQCIGDDMAGISSIEALPSDVDRDNENFTRDAFDPRAAASQNYPTIDPLSIVIQNADRQTSSPQVIVETGDVTSKNTPRRDPVIDIVAWCGPGLEGQGTTRQSQLQNIWSSPVMEQPPYNMPPRLNNKPSMPPQVHHQIPQQPPQQPPQSPPSPANRVPVSLQPLPTKKTSLQLGPSSSAAVSTLTSPPAPSASTPIVNTSTPTYTLPSSQTPKSRKGKVPVNPKTPASKGRRMYEDFQPPAPEPVQPPATKRPREDDASTRNGSDLGPGAGVTNEPPQPKRTKVAAGGEGQESRTSEVSDYLDMLLNEYAVTDAPDSIGMPSRDLGNTSGPPSPSPLVDDFSDGETPNLVWLSSTDTSPELIEDPPFSSIMMSDIEAFASMSDTEAFASMSDIEAELSPLFPQPLGTSNLKEEVDGMGSVSYEPSEWPRIMGDWQA